MLSRRSILLGGMAGLVACTRPKAKGFSGYAFIANQEGGAVAAVDLEVFAVARHIHVDGAPTAVVARPESGRVYALTPSNGSVHEISTSNLTLAGRLLVAHSALTMRLAGASLYVLCNEPKQLVRLALDPMRIDWTLPLPADPVDLEISTDGATMAISYGAARAISFVDLAGRKAFPPVAAPGEIGLVRFQPDSKQLIAANVSERMLSVYHVPTRKLEVNLPISVRPDHLCFKPDGGELFVTGEGMDAVVVVQPYYTPQVETDRARGPQSRRDGDHRLGVFQFGGLLVCRKSRLGRCKHPGPGHQKRRSGDASWNTAILYRDYAGRSVRAGVEPGVGRHGRNSHSQRHTRGE